MLATRVTGVMLGLVLATALAVAWWTHRQLQRVIVPSELVQMRAHAQQIADRLNMFAQTASSDAKAIAHAPVVHDTAAASQTNNPSAPQRAINESCARFFAAQLEAKPWIQQLRVISAQPPGMEVVRVDRSGVDNAVRIVPPEELQSKGSRDYFDAGVQLQDQEVYISKVELNAEKGAIEYPYQPVFRSVTPVIDESSGRAVAIVVINVRLEQVFDSLTSTLYPSSRVYIVDGNGDYLRHATNPDMEFAAAAGLQHHRWEEDFDTRRWTSGKYAQSTAVVTGPDEVRVGAVVARSQLEPGVQVIETAPFAEITQFAQTATTAALSVAGIAMIGALLLAVLVSTSLLRPLKQLSQTLKLFGDSHWDTSKLPRHGDFGFIAASFDELANQITQRTNALNAEIAERKATEERIIQVIDAAPVGMLAIDRNGNITLANRELQSTFGYTKDELLGAPIEILLPQRFREGHVHHRTSFVAHPVSRRMGGDRELYGLSKDKRQVPVDVGLNPLTTTSGPAVIASVVDITEQKQTQDALRQLNTQLEDKNAELEQFLYAASHDLKSPIVTIMGYTQHLMDDVQQGDRSTLVDYGNRIRDAASHMHGIVNDLLELSRVGRVKSQRQVVELKPLVCQLWDAVLEASGKPYATLKSEIEDNISVMMNPVHAAQLLQNVLENAMKYAVSENTSQIEVAATVSDDDRVQLTVRDHGPGINQQYHERVFGLFERLSQDKSGTGIGLATARRIASLNKGRIWVEDTPNGGATFVIEMEKPSD